MIKYYVYVHSTFHYQFIIYYLTLSLKLVCPTLQTNKYQLAPKRVREYK